MQLNGYGIVDCGVMVGIPSKHADCSIKIIRAHHNRPFARSTIAGGPSGGAHHAMREHRVGPAMTHLKVITLLFY
jgi:hypothetical protein